MQSFSPICESEIESLNFREPKCVIIHSGQVINVDGHVNNLSGFDPDSAITLAGLNIKGLNLQIRIPQSYIQKQLSLDDVKDALSTELRKFHTLVSSNLLPPEHIIDNDFVAFSITKDFNVLTPRLVSTYVLAFSNLDANWHK